MTIQDVLRILDMDAERFNSVTDAISQNEYSTHEGMRIQDYLNPVNYFDHDPSILTISNVCTIMNVELYDRLKGIVKYSSLQFKALRNFINSNEIVNILKNAELKIKCKSINSMIADLDVASVCTVVGSILAIYGTYRATQISCQKDNSNSSDNKKLKYVHYGIIALGILALAYSVGKTSQISTQLLKVSNRLLEISKQ